MVDEATLKELSGVKIDKRELEALRSVHHGIVDPLRDSLKTLSDERGFQKAAFKRIEFFVATLVECARESLLLAQAQDESINFSGLGDLQKLLVYLPEDVRFVDITQQLAMFQPGSDLNPLDVMKRLGLSIRADETTIDGKLRHTFTEQQMVEYGCIYMDNSRLTPFPTALKQPQAQTTH